MNTYRLIVATPEGNRFDGEAYMLSVRGVEGELAVMAGHVPFVTAVKAGRCAIELPDGEEKIGTMAGGLLTVAADKVTLLTGSVEW